MQKKIRSAPTVAYPESDGKPMAETEAHRDLMIDFILILKDYFENQEDVCVSGNMLMYYEEGDPKKVVAPDVFVAFGVEKKQRRTYRTWEEGHTPDFVLEVASPSTFKKDIGQKKDIYASVLAVKEYYIYDPLGQIVPSFIGYRLIDGEYKEIALVDERLTSEVLGLELGEIEDKLRLYNPKSSQWLLTPAEEIKKVRTRAANAEAELAKALAEIERLRG
jgi:Uma2 family endonuclease